MESFGGKKQTKRKRFLTTNAKIPRTTQWNRRKHKKDSLTDPNSVASTSTKADESWPLSEVL